MASERRRRQIAAGCVFLTLAIGVTALDLWTKDLVFEALDVESMGSPPHVVSQDVVVVVPGFFELEATYNRGAFYGWFSGHTGKLTLLSALAVVVIAGIFVFSLRQERPPGAAFAAALGLICAGTAGNLYDRYHLAAVRDWIKWFFVWDEQEYVWPNFNVADSAICVGVGIWILLEILNAVRDRRHRKGKVKAGA